MRVQEQRSPTGRNRVLKKYYFLEINCFHIKRLHDKLKNYQKKFIKYTDNLHFESVFETGEMLKPFYFL
jgi:hypothetical protein